MMHNFYLTGQVKTLSSHAQPIFITMVSEYLRNTIDRHVSDHEIEITNSSSHNTTHFSFSGAVRLEILFYEKRSPEEGREQITLYGVAENSRFQLRSFTLFYDTCWFQDTINHPDDRYFDSIIIEGGPAENIPSSSLDVAIWDSAGIVAGHSAAVLKFESAVKEREAPQTEVNPFSALPVQSVMSRHYDAMR